MDFMFFKVFIFWMLCACSVFISLWNKYFTEESASKLLCVSSHMKISENYKTCVFDRILESVIGLENLGGWHSFQSQGIALLQPSLVHVLLLCG